MGCDTKLWQSINCHLIMYFTNCLYPVVSQNLPVLVQTLGTKHAKKKNTFFSPFPHFFWPIFTVIQPRFYNQLLFQSFAQPKPWCFTSDFAIANFLGSWGVPVPSSLADRRCMSPINLASPGIPRRSIKQNQTGRTNIFNYAWCVCVFLLFFCPRKAFEDVWWLDHDPFLIGKVTYTKKERTWGHAMPFFNYMIDVFFLLKKNFGRIIYFAAILGPGVDG